MFEIDERDCLIFASKSVKIGFKGCFKCMVDKS